MMILNNLKLLAISLVVYAASVTFFLTSDSMSMEVDVTPTLKAKLIAPVKPNQQSMEEVNPGYIDDGTHIKNLAIVCTVGSCVNCVTVYGRHECCCDADGSKPLICGPCLYPILIPFQQLFLSCYSSVLCCQVDNTPPTIRKNIHDSIRCESKKSVASVMCDACCRHRNSSSVLAPSEEKKNEKARIQKNIDREKEEIRSFKEWQLASKQATMK